MTTAMIIGAVLVGVLALAYGAYRLTRRNALALQRSEDARLSADHEAKVSKAVAEEIAKDLSAEDIVKEWENDK